MIDDDHGIRRPAGKSGLLRFASMTLALLPILSNAAPPIREAIALDTWDWTLVGASATADNLSQWSRAPFPKLKGSSYTGSGSALWYRTVVDVPKSWSGRRVLLDLEGALYAPQVYVDGVKVAEYQDGYVPAELDLTAGMTPGKRHTLLVRCADQAATLSEPVTREGFRSGQPTRGKVLLPVGGYKSQIGFWAPVTLRTTPVNSIADRDLVISTSLAKGQISISGSARAGNGWTISVSLVDPRGGRISLGSCPLGKDGSWSIHAPIAKVRLWSPESPTLYQAQIDLREGTQLLDSTSLRTGFKEIRTDGPDFLLNGVRRHLLATSNWPSLEYVSKEEVRKRVRSVKKLGAIAFRLHIGGWQREFMDVADEEGLLMVVEAPYYTDDGSYAYNDPRFWQNYRQDVAGMIRRDRNHPSLVMWSLGNEILFMGNQRNAPDLPKKLGEVGRYAKSLDKDHLITFEADLDPDGAYDVIGLHYPHELPLQHAYPAIVDWLGSGKKTEAAGGMLGQSSSQFRWDRNKPLYIGEYLWVPYGDYSPGTVFFGDDAYRNRLEYDDKAKALAWIDQTIGYRRSGVSGLCPWSATGFGMAEGEPVLAAAQLYVFKKVAAYPRSRGPQRLFGGSTLKVVFDVFNDSPSAKKLSLSFGGSAQTIALPPAGRTAATFSLAMPSVASETERHYQYKLSASGVSFDQGDVVARIVPKPEVIPPRGWTFATYSGGDLGRVLEGAGPNTLLVVKQHALDPKIPAAAGKLPVVGGGAFDARRFVDFLNSGGRAVVLEQNDLSATGIGARLVEHASTMAFPLAGFAMRPEDLKFWGADMFVAERQIARSGVGGARALAVTGGPNSLAQSPLVVQNLGRGRVVFVQALAGAKRATEPAAADLISRCYELATEPTGRREGSVLVVGASSSYLNSLRALRLSFASLDRPLASQDVHGAAGLILCGDGPNVLASTDAVAEATRLGLPILLHRPTHNSFEALRGVLGVPQLQVESAKGVPILPSSRSPLLNGVTREDLCLTAPPAGWDRQLTYRTGTCQTIIVPAQEGGPSPVRYDADRLTIERGNLSAGVALFDRRGIVRFRFEAPNDGFYPVDLEAKTLGVVSDPPKLELRVDGEIVGRPTVQGAGPFRTVVQLAKGSHEFAFEYLNAPEWGGGNRLVVSGVDVGNGFVYPNGVQPLSSGANSAAWLADKSQVVYESFAWEDDPENALKGGCYAGALMSNLGFPFDVPQVEMAQGMPLSAFAIESGPYNEANPSSIVLRSNGSAAGDMFVATEADYEIEVTADSTSVKGVYAQFEVEIDGKKIGAATAASTTPVAVHVGRVRLSEGRHTVRVRFTNDLSEGTEDRNLTVRQIAFRR